MVALPIPHSAGDPRGLQLEALAAQIVLACKVAPPISDPHILMTRTKSVRLMRLAQQAAGAGILRTFALKMHVGRY